MKYTIHHQIMGGSVGEVERVGLEIQPPLSLEAIQGIKTALLELQVPDPSEEGLVSQIVLTRLDSDGTALVVETDPKQTQTSAWIAQAIAELIDPCGICGVTLSPPPKGISAPPENPIAGQM